MRQIIIRLIFAALVTLGMLCIQGRAQFSNSRGPFFPWYEPEADQHWMLVYVVEPHGCNLDPGSAVYCEPRLRAEIGVNWFKSEKAALEYAERTNVDVLGLYETKAAKLEQSESEFHERQPDVIRKQKHYRAK